MRKKKKGPCKEMTVEGAKVDTDKLCVSMVVVLVVAAVAVTLWYAATNLLS